MNPDLKSFAEQLLDQKGVKTRVDAEVFEQMTQDLVQRLEDRIKLDLLQALPDELLPAFDAILATNNDQAIQQFVATHIPNTEQVVSASLVAFGQRYLGNA